MKIKYYISQLSILILLIIGYPGIVLISLFTNQSKIAQFISWIRLQQNKVISEYIFQTKIRNAVNRTKTLKSNKETLRNKTYNQN